LLLAWALVCGGGCTPRQDSRADDDIPLVPPAPAATQPAPTQGDPPRVVVATSNGATVDREQLYQALLETHGLNVLLSLMQLELVRHEADQLGLAVSPSDVEAETEYWVREAFQDAQPDEYPQLLEQLLERQRLSRSEFDRAMLTNAYLRKIVEPQAEQRIAESDVREAYNALYGETVRVRHIQLANMQEVAEAQRRLAAGEEFAQVALAMSLNPRTKGVGGMIPPFSRDFAPYPQTFRDAAFALKVGEVSDPVHADGHYHLIKLEDRIAPKAVKYEDVRESVRKELSDRFVRAMMQQVRTQLGQQAIANIKIEEPTLKRQFQARLDERQAQIREREKVMEELERERLRDQQRQQQEPAQPQPDAVPDAPSDNSPDAQPALDAPEVGRPPATLPGQGHQPAPAASDDVK
jgi:foldase protein PrsA